MIRDLTDLEASLCAKNKDAALEFKQKANKCYFNGDYDTALAFYTRVLVTILSVLCHSAPLFPPPPQKKKKKVLERPHSVLYCKSLGIALLSLYYSPF